MKTDWNKLALENSRYYIYSDLGADISEDSFIRSGYNDYYCLIDNDPYFSVDGQIVLEVGCGTGRMTQFIAQKAEKVVGIDHSSEMVLQASQRVLDDNVLFMVNDGLHYSLQDNCIDRAFSYIVFQHMPTRDIVKSNLNEILRVLKPGGRAKIQVRGTPCAKGKWFTGVHFTRQDMDFLSEGFNLVKASGFGQKYLWLWLDKKYD